eukprot:g9070.t1
MHEQRRLGGLQAPRFRIASDTNNVSLIKLDVEKVGPTLKVAKKPRPRANKTASDGPFFEQAPTENPRTPNAQSNTAEEAMKTDVNKIRGYLDLLDEYSLHHFVIWHGKAIRDTPEFTSLARTNQSYWSSINQCVSILEEIMTVNDVPLAVIDGKQLAELARFDLERVDEADLCSVIANLEQIRPLLRHTRLVPNGPSAAQLAAVTIQATARRFLKRSGFLLLKRRRDCAIKLQCLVRRRRSRWLVAALLLDHRRQVESRWQELQDELRGEWENWRKSERVLILLPSVAADEHDHDVQISQMHWLVDQNVHVVLVLPSQPDDAVLEYHRKVLEMAGTSDAPRRMTVSGQKRVFAAADVSAPIGAHDVYDEEDLMVALTKLIACNLHVRRWHIKVDVCRGNRGLAVLDTSSLACMSGLKREKAQLERANGGPSGVWHHPDVQLLARARLLKTLRRSLHRVMSICNTRAYPTWAFFLGRLARVGGVIEAEAPEKRSHPSCSVFISPSGEISCLSEIEILYDACYQHVGCVHPQECVSSRALRGASVAVSRELWARGVMGYVSIHFVVFWDDRVEAPRLWATGLELGMSVSAFSFCFFRSVTKGSGRGGREGADLGCYEEATDGDEMEAEGRLHYVYLDHVHHPSLRSVRVPVFFKLCRLEGISFDLCTRVGTIFNLVDSLACGTVGVLITERSRQATLEKAHEALKFIRRITKERFAPGQEEPLSKEMWSVGQDLLRLKANKEGSPF